MATRKKGSRDGTKLVGGHFPEALAKRLKVLAAKRGTSVQALLEEAIRDLFLKHK